MKREEELKKIAKRYAQDELKDNHGQVEDIVAAAFLNGIDYAWYHPRWISVEDELPDENRWVLTYNGTSINLLMLAGNGNWYDHSVTQHRNVTHWMLVEPPAKLSSLERTGKNWKE